MSAPNQHIVLKRNEPLEDENLLTLRELAAYVAGMKNISMDDAKQLVMDALATGEFNEFIKRSSGGNH